MNFHSDYFKKLDSNIRDSLKREIESLTEDQKKLFNCMYPIGIDKIPFEKLDWCFYQLENTITRKCPKCDGKRYYYTSSYVKNCDLCRWSGEVTKEERRYYLDELTRMSQKMGQYVNN